MPSYTNHIVVERDQYKQFIDNAKQQASTLISAYCEDSNDCPDIKLSALVPSPTKQDLNYIDAFLQNEKFTEILFDRNNRYISFKVDHQLCDPTIIKHALTMSKAGMSELCIVSPNNKNRIYVLGVKAIKEVEVTCVVYLDNFKNGWDSFCASTEQPQCMIRRNGALLEVRRVRTVTQGAYSKFGQWYIEQGPHQWNPDGKPII